ncbi:MAG: hypothetical protein AB1430_14765 [Pseudomonadota bacterium]
MKPATTTPPSPPQLPWWRVKMLWLVLGGPAAVVVAGVVTTVIAVNGSDPVVSVPAVAPQAADTAELSTAPALQARNHVAAAAAR